MYPHWMILCIVALGTACGAVGYICIRYGIRAIKTGRAVSDRNTSKTAFADLGADSLDTVELIMAFEEEADVSVPDDVYERIRTVGDAIRYIEEQRRRRDG